MSRGARMVCCGRCGLTRRRGARGLCIACYSWVRYHGCAEDYPLDYITTALIVEEAFHPARAVEGKRPEDTTGPNGSAVGRQFVRTAREMGLSQGAAQRAYYRAVQRGLIQPTKGNRVEAS